MNFPTTSPMGPEPEDRQERLKWYVETQVARLGRTETSIWKGVGKDHQTWHRWKNGKGDVRLITDQTFSEAIGWVAGSRDAILNGGQPTLIKPRESATTNEVELRWQELRDQVDQLPDDQKKSVTSALAGILSMLDEWDADSA